MNSIIAFVCFKTEPPRPSKKPMPVYDTSGTLLVTATTITIRMPVCYYNDDHGPIKKIQILVTEAGGMERLFNKINQVLFVGLCLFLLFLFQFCLT